jgi:type III secretion system YscQ/HrcQ family protein
MENTGFQQHGLVRLCLDSNYTCEAEFTSTDKTALTIKTGWNPMTDNEQKQNIEHISQIPVQLSFDLGQKTLSFNEVRQLRPGYILELGITLPEIIQIRSQNRLIGTGELVEVNGRVGVRIINLFSKKAKGN